MLDNIDLSQTFNIAIMGRANTGKSSLMNTLLQLSRREALQVSKVGIQTHLTKDFVIQRFFNDDVYLIDTPPIHDQYFENHKITNIINNIDLVILVVDGYPVYGHKYILQKLSIYDSSVFVVLNGMDKWDNCFSDWVNYTVSQWANYLNVDKIYPTCIRGYNPTENTQKMDIRGVDLLRQDINNFINAKNREKQTNILEQLPVKVEINNKTQEILTSKSTKKAVSTLDIESVLKSYQQTAIESYNINLKYSQDLTITLASFRNNISQKNYSKSKNQDKEIKNVFNGIIQLIDNILTQDLQQLNESLAIKKKHIKDYTIVLFGRTRAGKSTIREALTKGDGSTIGKGGQRTTRYVHEYRWNHLRLIDTPGIDAYEGEEDTDKAIKKVDEADMVLFLSSDDSVQPSEFEQMGRLSYIEKPFIVLLNVKGKLENETQIKRFLAKPEKTFDEERLSGHHNHIKTYVKQHLAIEEVQIIDIHARAGFLSNQLEYQEYKTELWQLSQLDKVYSIIAEDIYKNGNERRASTFFDGTKVLINDIKKQLDFIEKNIGDKISFFQTKEKEVKQIFTQQIKDSKSNIDNEVKQLFRQFKQEIPAFIEYSIENQNAEQQWKQKTKNFSDKLGESMKILCEKNIKELKAKLLEFEREYKYDAQSITINYKLENIYKAGFGDFVKNLSVLFSGMTLIFVAINWWNPVGWVAMAGWVATGFGVVTGLFSGGLKHQEKKEFQQKKDKLKNDLIKDIDTQQTKIIGNIHQKIEGQFKDIEKEILSSLSLSRQELYSINNELLTIKVRIKDILDRLDIDKSLILQQSAKKNI
ncbi:GTPase [Geminocystis sp. CENA526]|uniref:GTPase n=1 Tax=Geminocystis sp. CENA526 TaxID=1355871 RepID=UPI003D6EDF8C